MRRIALVCDWYHPRRGGIEAQLDGLATRLAARGHDVQVITSTPGPGDVNGVRVHRLGVPLVPFAGVAARPVAADIARIFTRERIDVVHSHVSIVAPVALAGALAAHRLALPSVVTFHSFVPATPLLAAPTGVLLGASRWRAVYTAVSRRVAREVAAFAPNARFGILPNAIDTDYWTPAASPRSGNEVRLVYAGRIERKKRPLLLLRVLRVLAREAGAIPWSLTIAGDGTLADVMKARVRELGLESRVSFLGWTDRESLRATLRGNDVFLSTATRESFGLAALEARAVGLAVVAVRDSAVSDFIAHEQSGLLVDDDKEFAAAALRLVQDSELRRRLTDFNRRSLAPYGWDQALTLTEAAYTSASRVLRGDG